MLICIEIPYKMFKNKELRVLNIKPSPFHSAVAFTSALYSDSVLERETVAYLRALQAIKLGP
jgi:hypothetical protein